MKIVKDLNFAEFRSELFHTLDNIKEIVLSTTSQNRVTSRVVSCACYGPKIYFLSWDHHTKCRDCGVFVDKSRWVNKESHGAINRGERPLCNSCWSEYDYDY